MTIDIYTDGSCLQSPEGPGGYAAILLTAGREVHRVSGYLPRTNHTRAEMMGIIAGLEALDGPAHVTVYSDNQALVNSAARLHKRRKHADLWQRLDEAAARHTVAYRWVRGHNGDVWNGAAHDLCGQAARDGLARDVTAAVAPPALTPEAAVALEFARACLGWADARLAPRQAAPLVTTLLAPPPGDRLYYTNLNHVLAAAAAWCHANEEEGRRLRVGVAYVPEERQYVGSVLLNEELIQEVHHHPCQALLQACLLAARSLTGDATAAP
jgi:ribonuclease HI